MELLGPADVLETRVVRTLKHGRLTPAVMLAFFLAPLALVLPKRAEFSAFLLDVPWFAWLLAGPFLLLVAGLWLLCVVALLHVVVSSFRATNWIVKTTDEGLYLNLRSYQNRHFPEDGSSVVFLRYGEIAGVRSVTESYERDHGGDRALHRLRWVELELAGADTEGLAARIDHERTREAPERRILGVRARMRSRHVPVMVPAPGVIRVERVARALLRELGRNLPVRDPRPVDLDQADERDLERRVRGFLARGETLAAVELVQRSLGLSLTAARERVRALEGAAAPASRSA